MDRSPRQPSRRQRPRPSPSGARRQWRFVFPIGIVALVAAAIAIDASSGGGGSSKGESALGTRTVLVAHPSRPLPAAVWGESVVATKQGPLILGGLDASGSSAGGVFLLNPTSGRLSEAGSLTGPLHDSAAAVLGKRVVVFGGGTEASTDAVQALSAPGGVVAAGANAEAIGRLPSVRSDLSAVTVGETAYVLGGYDGSKPIDSVLATTDGSTFTQIARLPAPARYLAVAALGGRIYAFGGETASGSAGDAIQEFDPRRGS